MKPQKDIQFLTGPLESPKGFKGPSDRVMIFIAGFGLGMVMHMLIVWGGK